MQALVMQDISRVDINLDPQHLDEQVIARSGRQRGVLDLLAVTKSKRLVILELKATENPVLPLQAADYWKKIRQHHARGDLARYGYFAPLQLQPAPPLVYLVAPALRFHPTTETILKYLSPELEIIRVDCRRVGAESCAWSCGMRMHHPKKRISGAKEEACLPEDSR
jgi:hypothetical protein